MGLIANVYACRSYVKQGIDCTNNGWSWHYDRACIVNADGPFEPSDDAPAVLIKKHSTMHVVHVVLVQHDFHNIWTMMGGNFLHSCDSRFGEAVANILGPQFRYHGPIAIHDRIEE